MSDNSGSIIHSLTDGGIVARHPLRVLQPVLVGPSTANEFNTVEEELSPVACVRLEDLRFDFDSSFVVRDVSIELKALAKLRKEIPGMPLSVFGHADPVGDDIYNKELSGRRAQAVYALLTRKTELWEDLYKHPHGRDNWKESAIQRMLTALGLYGGPITGKLDGPTREAVKEFQRSPAGEGLKDDGDSGPNTRPKLFRAYMNLICVDEEDNSFELSETEDFLAHGADKKGKGDYQGCGEFNPVAVFSQADDLRFKHAVDKTDRDRANQKNRRVLIFLFRPGAKVSLDNWPCPRVKEGVADCKNRFFFDGEDRRNPQVLAREYKTTKNTFACRFYDGLAQESPCEIGPPAQTVLLRVYLRLLYLDPDLKGPKRVFPSGVPVSVKFADGTTEEQKVDADGRLTFNVDRRKQSFTLQFSAPPDQTYYIASATASTKGSRERFITEGEIPAALADDYRVFSLPRDWSLSNSDWNEKEIVRSVPTFGNHAFRQLTSPAVTVGSQASPVDMVLDPHWQCFKLTYFDRNLKKRLSTLPVMVEGFTDAAKSGGWADTSSNWTTGSGEDGCQCLPWIVRRNAAGKEEPKPDKQVLLQFQFKSATYIESIEGGFRRLVTTLPSDQPSADRLRFYDLPQMWKSRQYFARLSSGSGGAAAKEGRFEDLAAEATTSDKPLVFSLDDMVLTDDKLKPVDWNPSDPDSRVAIFSNTFSFKESDGFDRIGPYKPDDSNKQSYNTQLPQVEKDRNYIADYPDWTRCVLMKGNVYDAFERRTPDVEGQVVGARAAVRWVDVMAKLPPGKVEVEVPDPANPGKTIWDPSPTGIPVPGAHIRPPLDITQTSPFCVIQPYFDQQHTSSTDHTPHTIGRFDMVLFRCCDKNGDEEIAVNFQYHRFNFNFSPPKDPNFASEESELKDKAKQDEFANTTVLNIPKRWNAVDGYNPFPAFVIPEDRATHRLRVRVLWFVQAMTKPELAHFEIRVYKEIRDHMSSWRGIGAFEEASKKAQKGGRFTAAHETGHAGSMDDEYMERWLHASYGQPGVIHNGALGAPYSLDDDEDADETGMMKGNKTVRTRYFWHVAEWLYSLYKFDFKVQHGYFDFKLPIIPTHLDGLTLIGVFRKRKTPNPGAGRSAIYSYSA